MLKYLSGLFTGSLLGIIAYSTYVAWFVSEKPEAWRKYYDYAHALTH